MIPMRGAGRDYQLVAEPYPQDEHDAIVDQLRRKGWDKQDAEQEADILMAARIARRKEATQ